MDPVLVITNFFLCFIRFMGVCMLLPLISSPNFPRKLKAMLAYFVSFVVFLNLPVDSFVALQTDVELLIIGLKEFLVGVVIGLNVVIVMEVMAFAGSIISTPMGLSIATAIDPASGESSTTMGQFNVTLATFIFLIINGHHHAMSAFLDSYRAIPIGKMLFEQNSAKAFIALYYKLFLVSLQVAMPILVAMILIHFSLGVVVRSLPRLNIFMIGIPLQITLGMVTYVIIMPFMVKTVKYLFMESFATIPNLLGVFL